MPLFEAVLAGLTAFLLVAHVWSAPRNYYLRWLTASSLLVWLLHAMLEGLRWQMYPAYAVLLILTVLLFKQTQAHVFLRLMGFLSGLALIGTSVFLAAQLPIVRLPTPQGPFSVGTTTFSLADSTRTETLGPDQTMPRELFVEVWYPAAPLDARSPAAPRPLWHELYRGDLDRVSFFMRYLKHVPTHAYPDVALASGEPSFPLLLFNHGLQMFTAQNTLLMEHLASHGYIILSIGHPYESLRITVPEAEHVLPPFITSAAAFQEAMAWVEETSRPIRAAVDSIRKVDNRAIRASIMLETLENMSDLNHRVAEWVTDTQFVLDHVLAGSSAYIFSAGMHTTRIGVMGMSLGGATASAFCKRDTRCHAGINIDGLNYGERLRQPLTVPFLMLYSDDAPFVNDFLRINAEADFHEYWAPKTRHADFTDFAVVWPLLRTTGQLGPFSGTRMATLLNDVTLHFLDHYVKGTPQLPFPHTDYPELVPDIQYASAPTDSLTATP